MDRELNIDTAAIREWQDIESQIIYNRTEATPYQAIDKLFDYYELLPNANFVDFGCGSGRMAFYVHNRFEIPVTGVELNNLTYTDLLNNKETYLSKNTRQNAPLNLIRDYAEKYTITKEQNTFYFFNPFTVSIFDKVISNIEQSILLNPRDADIILYYPVYELQQVMREKSFFQRVGSINLRDIFDDEYEKFIVYHFDSSIYSL
ncbi:MAG TPA: SAM-dependent methyltransferase [Candidatus Eisenbacteria bacterium]|nr:SAM-dependent methyltransferase [Candidatus Eisenbacteria bacterium]